MQSLAKKIRTFFNNQKLKAAGVQIEYTKAQLEEYLKCKQDFFYFLVNYVHIISLDKGIIKFVPRSYQKKLAKLVHENRFVIAKIPRQYGKTITIVAYFLWVILFQDHQTIGILANKGETARKILKKLQFSYEQLPFWMQQGVVEWNKGSIELENGSKVIASATTEASGRSEAFNMILLDEFAFVPKNTAEDFYKSVYPTLTSGTTTKVFIVSTPNGMNLFYKFWTDAVQQRNGYKHLAVHWSDMPGRDEAWKKAQIKALGSEEAFNQEFGCEFLGSQHTLVGGKKLRELAYVPPIYSSQGLDIYEHELPGRVYITIVDTSRGQELDYSAFTVVDATHMPYRVVAKYRDKSINPLIYPSVVVSVAKKYNDAHVLVEINDNGKQIADIIYEELEYENLLHVQRAQQGRKGQKLSAGFGDSKTQRGLMMSKQTKMIGCSILRTLVEDNHLVFQDFDLISEFTTFVASGSSFEAEQGSNDDLVMTLVGFAWLTTQEYFKELTNTNLRMKLNQARDAQAIERNMPIVVLPGEDRKKTEIGPDGNLWTVVSTQTPFSYK